MTAPAWSFIATDGRNGGKLISAEAPYANVKFLDGIDQGNLTCDVDLSQAGDIAADLIDIDRTVIWPCIDGTPVGAWIVTSPGQRDLGTTTQQIVCQPALWRILEGRLIRDTLVFKTVEQLDMARDLIRYATGLTPQWVSAPYPRVKAEAYQVPWLRFEPDARSGKLRERLDNTDGWQASGRKSVAECLRSLIDLEDGFEVQTVAGLDTNRMPYLEVRFGYPEFGDTTTVGTLEWPSGTLTAGSVGADGSDRASLVDAISDGEAPNQLIATARSAASEARRIPREVAYSAGKISVFSTLQAKANASLRQDGPPVLGFALTTSSGGQVRPYSFPWGSRFRLVIDDPGYPADASGRPFECVVRVRGADISVGGFGKADTVNLSCEVVDGV